MRISTIINPEEKRVAITPETAGKYLKLGFEVVLPKGIGESAGFSDVEYLQAGAKISSDEIKDVNLYLCVKPRLEDFGLTADDVDTSVDPTIPEIGKEAVKEVPSEQNRKFSLSKGSYLIALLSPFRNAELLKRLFVKGVTPCALEKVPRITRAQSMDILSSQANIAGYKAMVDAMAEYGRVIPLMMTAAGTVRPARVLILGAGVAGLQAIATAKRMGALVSAFDVRRAAKEQVESLGATFVEVSENENGETVGGYAREMSEEYKKKQAEKLAESLKNSDIVVTTAQIPGKPAPRLITADMVKSMASGSVIVDMAAETGGNCELSRKDEKIAVHGVTIMGYTDFAARVANDSSRLFARNMFNFVSLMLKDGKLTADDEIIQATIIK